MRGIGIAGRTYKKEVWGQRVKWWERRRLFNLNNGREEGPTLQSLKRRGEERNGGME